MNLSPRDVELGRQFSWYHPHLKWLGNAAEELADVDAASADLSGADLSGADLYRADLYRANLYGANLCAANLYGANLCGANLYGANLYGAIGIVSFGPVGDFGRIGYVVAHDPEPFVQLGCWWGPLSATLDKLRAERTPGYVAIVKAAALVLSEQVRWR